MRTFFLTLLLCALFESVVFGQVKLGLKFSPAFSFNRVESPDDMTLSISNSGTGVRFGIGLIGDYNFTENYAFSTGIIYTPKRVAIQEQAFGPEQLYRVQYLQIPLTLKLFTNEISLDKRLYFQIGGAPEILINEEDRSLRNFIGDFSTFDFSVLLGAGLEFQIGESTGFTYSRGLIDAVSSTTVPIPIEIKNDLFSLDVGIKF